MARPEVARDKREQITDLLLQIREGNPDAMDRLFHAVYGELRRIASHQRLAVSGAVQRMTEGAAMT